MSLSRIAGRYELQQPLGEGGMGVVWRALDLKTGGLVAIKLMKDISDPEAVELFTNEWRALAELSHPNIVEVRDVDVIEENRQKKPFFVMPLLRGTTLAELIANASARLTLERIVEITTHVCRGLQAAHQRGLVHRDLKPSNIFVMDDDTAKIIDFGVVHLAGSKSVTGQKGTFQYMSPEQAQLKEITPASDIFSLGVILYEALTRRKPFARKTAEETMEAVIKLMPPPVSELYPSINQQVSKVVYKCLAKQPIHRFASARELAETLQKAARNEPVFDSSKIEPRIERARAAFKSGDEVFGSEILAELESEGNLDPRITVLRTQIEMAAKAKKIRQLLESARARMEQDEIPLALDKIREALELDPENADALAVRHAIEKQRSETQITRWLELAQTHLNNRDFGAARSAAREVLAFNRADSRAADLLEKIESAETEVARIRELKEQLYSYALRAYQNGEISTALSKFERLFSLAQGHPNAEIPERDAVYQSFYKEVRSERETIHRALEDAKRQLREKNFASAMAVCNELLRKYPNDGTFQALRVDIEVQQNLETSGFIAEIDRRAQMEPDLEKRAAIFREATERYPEDQHFKRFLELVNEKKKVVDRIVESARRCEERGELHEALLHLEELSKIYDAYPGLRLEIERIRMRGERQRNSETRGNLATRISNMIRLGQFVESIDLLREAKNQFPGDSELEQLEELAQTGIERSRQAAILLKEGTDLIASGQHQHGLDSLRKAYALDQRNGEVRKELIASLAQQSLSICEVDWRAAEVLAIEASELDSSNPVARNAAQRVADQKRESVVEECLSEARALLAQGKRDQVLATLNRGLDLFPQDNRLRTLYQSARPIPHKSAKFGTASEHIIGEKEKERTIERDCEVVTREPKSEFSQIGLTSFGAKEPPQDFFATTNFSKTTLSEDDTQLKFAKFKSSFELCQVHLYKEYKTLSRQAGVTHFLWVFCILISFCILILGLVFVYRGQVTVGAITAASTALVYFTSRSFQQREDHYRGLANAKNTFLEYGNECLLIMETIEVIPNANARVEKQIRLVEVLTNRLQNSGLTTSRAAGKNPKPARKTTPKEPL